MTTLEKVLATIIVALAIFALLVFVGVVQGFGQYNVTHEPALVKGCRWKGSCTVRWIKQNGVHEWLIKNHNGPGR